MMPSQDPDASRHPIAQPSIGRPDEAEVSLVGLLRSLAEDTTSLVSKELALARAEVGQSVEQARTAIASIAIGAGVLFCGLILLLVSGVFALVEIGGFSRWSAALLVGAIVAGVGLLLVGSARTKLSASSFVPDRTIQSLQKDQSMVRSKVS